MGPKGQYFRSRYIRFVGQSLFWTPILVALFAAYIFAAFPQMREVYLGLIEAHDWPRIVTGLALLALFCAFLSTWHRRVALSRIDTIYPEHADIYFDRDILKIRDLKACLVASLPMFGLFIGLLFLYGRVSYAAQDVSRVLELLKIDGYRAAALEAQFTQLPLHTIIATSFVVILGLVLVTLLYLGRDHRIAGTLLRWACYIISLVVLLLPVMAPDASLTIARSIGPLAGCSAVLITLAVLVQVFIYLLQLTFNLILSFVAGALILIATLPGMAKTAAYAAIAVSFFFAAVSLSGAQRFLATEEQQKFISAQNAQSAQTQRKTEIEKSFEAWLSRRRDRSEGRYPVFIIAAQGGGIYAASSVASFLAAMQDRCPQFAQHVFATSAVSGGAIGASIFNALLQDQAQVGEAGCDDQLRENLIPKVRNIVEADHLTPVVLKLLPDALGQEVIGGLGSIVGFAHASSNRARMLEESFSQSFSDVEAEDSSRTEHGLSLPYSKHWRDDGIAPALLLNATWAETGYRVAFSPFALREISDGTLYSFADLDRAGDADFQDPTLIEASSISARFPVILPSWSVSRSNSRDWSSARWTFVDGGYADNSGATTALEIYKAISESAGNNNADVYMILLTNASADPEFSKIGSSWFEDIAAPLRTLLRIRELLGWRAVTQVKQQLGDRVITIQLEHRAFPLPLGWKISHASNALIEFMSGRPEGCTERGRLVPNAERARLAINTFRANSCELKRLVSLLQNSD